MLIFKDNKLEEFKDDLKNSNGKISFEKGDKVEINSKGEYIVPGFIDQHIHGAGGFDVCDNSKESILGIAQFLVKEGTTSFFPTTMTYDLDVVRQSIEKVVEARSENEFANILKVHLEGPFISKTYIGAQNPEFVKMPDIETLKYLDPNGEVGLITYAVEEDGNFEFTKYLKENNIIGSVGHSDATCACVQEAIKNGLSNFTHFYNAASPHTHRRPGVVSAGLVAPDNVKLEMIVDGIHVHPDAVKVTYDIKGSDNLILITDAMRAKGMEDGVYDLGGQEVTKTGNEARLANGALAGSVLLMNNAVQNFIEYSGSTKEEAFQMASLNVAKHHNIENKGLIKEGFDFDITVLDKDFNVVQTIVNGKTVYSV